eukprot:TRINITY_DN5509_c0_g1_i1.p1 TRINITY_DN5509_c0_g1~~TRINITY_DN5509_c0_g1_i1.p1  ORF type:complete len:480 (+),score=89.67 TRINITY_DN5509_c0_g1_i1:253-1692(+)
MELCRLRSKEDPSLPAQKNASCLKAEEESVKPLPYNSEADLASFRVVCNYSVSENQVGFCKFSACVDNHSLSSVHDNNIFSGTHGSRGGKFESSEGFGVPVIAAEALARASSAAEGLERAKTDALWKAAEASRKTAIAKEALNFAAIILEEERTKKKMKKGVSSESSIGRLIVSPSFLAHDEELALQLHRAMNSSPRISRKSMLLGKTKSCLGLDYDIVRSRPGKQTSSRRRKKKRLENVYKRKIQVGSGDIAKDVKLPQLRGAGRRRSGLIGKRNRRVLESFADVLDHSEAESSAGLLALSQDVLCQTNEVEDSVPSVCEDQDQMVFEASLGLKELRTCNSIKNSHLLDVADVASNLEKLAETVAVVMEEEHHKFEEGNSELTLEDEDECSCFSKSASSVAESCERNCKDRNIKSVSGALSQTEQKLGDFLDLRNQGTSKSSQCSQDGLHLLHFCSPSSAATSLDSSTRAAAGLQNQQ